MYRNKSFRKSNFCFLVCVTWSWRRKKQPQETAKQRRENQYHKFITFIRYPKNKIFVNVAFSAWLLLLKKIDSLLQLIKP